MGKEILTLITSDRGEIIAGSEPALRLLGARKGMRCRAAVGALAGESGRPCQQDCTEAPSGRPPRDHSLVRVAADSYGLVCTATDEFRVITLLPLAGRADLAETLTPREREVLALVARGCTNARIGRHLKLAPSTVRTHMEHILEKLGVRTQAAAARAIAAGVIPSLG